MKELDYYKSNEILSQKYYQIPQELFESSLYKDKLNSDSKILYAFLLDRLTLSKRNHWIDENNRIFLIFTRQEVGEKLGLSEKTVTKAFKQLIDTDLIAEKRQGLGRPNLIYVAKIQYEEKVMDTDTENLQFLNSNFYGSGAVKNTVQEQENFPAINTNNIKTNIINTESINPKSDGEISLQEIKNKCRLNEFKADEVIVLEDVIDSLYYKNNLKVDNVILDNTKIKNKLKLINKSNLQQLLEILRNTPNIQNSKNYLITCLYNNLGVTAKNNTKNNNKWVCENQREYPTDYFDFLYANNVCCNAVAST